MGDAQKIQLGQSLLISLAHLVTDTYGGFIAVLLPYFIARWGLSLAAAGALLTAFYTTSNFSQLVFGWAADRGGKRWYLAVGLFVLSILLGTLGNVSSFGLMLLWVSVGGLASAAFHPPAAEWARQAGGRRRSLITSIFLQAGMLGAALGPLEILAIVTNFGLEASFLAALPGVVTACLVFRFYPRTGEDTSVGSRGGPPIRSLLAQAWPSLVLIWAIVVLRTITSNAFGSFLPVLMKERGASIWMGGIAVSVYLAFGSLGGILGGYLGDQFDRRRIIGFSLFLAVASMGCFLLSGGWLSMILLAAGGAFMVMSGPINLVMAQEMYPKYAGTVSSIMMGVAFGIGNLGMVAVGALGDRIGIALALALVMVGALGAAWLSFRLPKEAGSPRRVVGFADRLPSEAGG